MTFQPSHFFRCFWEQCMVREEDQAKALFYYPEASAHPHDSVAICVKAKERLSGLELSTYTEVSSPSYYSDDKKILVKGNMQREKKKSKENKSFLIGPRADLIFHYKASPGQEAS